jgi:hypothetical protein
MNTFDEFDEQTDFSFMSLEEPAPVAVTANTPKKSRSVQTGNITVGFVTSYSTEARAKISAAKTGSKLSDAHKAKISATKTGSKLSIETKAKISKAFTGRKHPHSAKSKASISLSLSKQIMTPAGIFGSRKEATEFYKVKPWKFGDWMLKHPQQFYYITKD